jgi:hypothetical protein
MALRRLQPAPAVRGEAQDRDKGQGNLRQHSLAAQAKAFARDYKAYLPLALALVFVLAAFWGYSGRQASKLGPPLGAILGQDARQVLRAAREIEAGENPYTHALEFARAPSFKEFMTWDAGPYPYPPIIAIMAQPLLRLSTAAALDLWSGINIILLLLCAWLAVSSFSNVGFGGRVTRFILILALFFVYAPTQIDLKLVQLDILILFLLLSTYYLYHHDLDWAGIPLGLAIAVKPVVIPWLLFFIWKRRWRQSSVAFLTAGLLTAVGFSIVGWSRLQDYLEVNRLWASSAILVYPFNQSVAGLALRLFTTNTYNQPLWAMPQLTWIIPSAVGLLAFGAWLVSVSRGDNRKEASSGVEFGLTLTTTMLLSPLVDDIHFVWVLMPLAALLLGTLDHLRRTRDVFSLLGYTLVALYLSSPLLHAAIYAGSASLLVNNTLVAAGKVLFTGAYLYGLIALDICLLVYLHRRRMAVPTESYDD